MNFSKTKHGDDLLYELSKQSTPIPLKTLENRLNVSRRSIFYTIKQVNKELCANDIDEIQNIRDSGYLLTVEAKKFFLSHIENSTKAQSFSALNSGNFYFKNFVKTDRILLMKYFLISRSYTSLNYLTTLFDVSKNTVITDIRKIKQDFAGELIIKNGKKGKFVIGNERSKRKWIFSHLNIVLEKLDGKYDFVPNPIYIKQLHLLEQITGNTFTDDTRNFLAYFIQWTVERVHNGFSYKPVSFQETQNNFSLTYIWAKSFLHDVNIHNDFEVKLLAELVNTQSFSHINTNNKMLHQLLPITKKIIHEFSNLTNIILPTNIGNHNFQKSLTVHLISTYYRGKYNIPYHNPLLHQIKTSYRETFEITKAALKPFTEFSSIELSDDEVALITIYFSGALRSTQLNKDKPKNLIAVVCSSGIGTSRLLFSQLVQRYPNLNFIGPLNMFEFENLSKKNIKLILTTTKILVSSSIDTFQIPALPSTVDWTNLDSYLIKNDLIKTSSNTNLNILTIMDIISNYARIVEPQNLENALLSYISKPASKNSSDKNYFSTYNIIDSKYDWQTAIHLSFKEMLKNNIVTEEYISEIINLTKKRGDYMAIGKGVFLAHATPTGVNQLGVSFNYFKDPFYISNKNKPIRFVVGLAPIDQKSHLTILSNLLQCLQNETWLAKLTHIEKTSNLRKLLISGHLI